MGKGNSLEGIKDSHRQRNHQLPGLLLHPHSHSPPIHRKRGSTVMEQKRFFFLIGISLAVQRLGLCTSTVGGTGSIHGAGTKIQHAA